MSLGGAAALCAGGPAIVLGAEAADNLKMATNPTFKIGGDLTVNRLGFGAMRITGDGIWGWPADRPNALKVLRRAISAPISTNST